MGLATQDQPGDNIFRVAATESGFGASMVVELGTQARSRRSSRSPTRSTGPRWDARRCRASPRSPPV